MRRLLSVHIVKCWSAKVQMGCSHTRNVSCQSSASLAQFRLVLSGADHHDEHCRTTQTRFHKDIVYALKVLIPSCRQQHLISAEEVDS